MKTSPVRAASVSLLICLLFCGTFFPGSAIAYQISYDHYVFATGDGASQESDRDYLNDGPLRLDYSFTHTGDSVAPNSATVNYFADIDQGTLGAHATATGALTDFWPYGFTATGRVNKIHFEVEIYFYVPAGSYPEGVDVSTTGQVIGSLSATTAASAQVQYTLQFQASSLTSPLLEILNDESLTMSVNDPFELTTRIVNPGTILTEPAVYTVQLRAYIQNMRTSTILTGTSPLYTVGASDVDFYTGVEFTEIIVPGGVNWSTDTGVFLNEEDISAVGDTPIPFRLSTNYPNPFNPATSISYHLERTAQVALSIFDVSGRLVRLLDSGIREAGDHMKSWDGRNDSGNAVPSGTYFYSLEAGGAQETKKMTLVR